MGYDMNLRLTVTPEGRYQEVASAIEEQCNLKFEGNGAFVSGMVRWSGMTEEMTELSKRFPDTWIQILAEGEDGAMWAEWFRDGNAQLDSRPDWEPPAVPGKKKYTVIFLYPDFASSTYGEDTWLEHSEGDSPEAAIADALDRWNEYRLKDDPNVSPYSDDEAFCITCIEGVHQDVKP